jgi:hypothetical protein
MPVERSRRSLSPETWRAVFPRAVVVVALVVLGCYAFAAYAFTAYGSRLYALGWTAGFDRDSWYVSQVDPASPADGLLAPGDRVVSVTTEQGPVAPGAASPATLDQGTEYVVRVERDGVERDVTLATPATCQWGLSVAIACSCAISLACFALALLLGLTRPDLPIARLGCVTFFAAALGFLSMALDPVRPFFVGWERGVYAAITVAGPLDFAFAYHFFRSVPRAGACDGLWKALTYVFYALAVLFIIPNAYVLTVVFANSGGTRVEAAPEGGTLLYAYFVAYRVYMVTALGAGYAVMIRNYLRVTDLDERRRIRWAVYGTAASVLPFVLLQVVDFVAVSLGARSIVADAGNFALVQSIQSLFILIPATFGYTILKHRVFDVDVAVRQGVRYLFAKGVIEVLLALPVVGLVIRVLRHPDMTVGELLFDNWLTLALIAAAAASLALRARLRERIDRRFFRNVYDSERLLLGLVDDIKEQESISDISRRVSTELEAALHPKRLIIVYRGEDDPDLMVGYSSGEHDVEAFRLPSNAEILRILEGDSRAHLVAADSEQLPPEELDLLHRHKIVLVVPMLGSDRRLVGLLLLGEKRSEEPYSRRDRALLEAVAAQMAIVRENAELKDRVARDRRIRVEVLGRMESAHVNLVKECPRCGACYDSTAERCALDGAELTLSLPVERTIEGKYRLDRLIGKGGMGAVYEGTDLKLARQVAVKILTGSMFGDRAALRRFEREAQASARLSHPNVVRVYDYGGVGSAGAFLVMELIAGHTLRAELVRSGRLAPRTATRIFEQIFDGVEAAHAAGIVHRDLKPENVLLTDDGRRTVKLLDFGLAKMRNVDVAESTSLTAPGTVMGTFGYMSPEQLSGGEVDERADVFSLGVMVYEALVGQKPYAARTWVDLIAATTVGNVHVPGAGPGVRHLERVLKRAMAGNARDRYASVAELRAELVPAMLEYRPSDDAVEVDESEPTKIYGEPLG